MIRNRILGATLIAMASLVPFIVTLAIVVVRPLASGAAVVAMIDYGAIVLSFSGAVHWGFALRGTQPDDQQRGSYQLVFGIIPALVGFLALLCTTQLGAPGVALGMLIAGYFATIVGETIGRGRQLVPTGYLVIRWVMSIVTLGVLVSTLFIVLVGMRSV